MLVKKISKILKSHSEVIDEISINQKENLLKLFNLLCHSFKNKKKLLIFGNGGSATDATHFAAELSGKYKKVTRKPLNAISLNDNIASITAISNDFSFNLVFSRQLKALASKGDIALGISTSGNSKNIINGLKVSKDLGLKTVALCGLNSKKLDKICDFVISVPSTNTARVQEVHILYIHILCELLDEKF